jgi:hypothetical protein
MSDREIHGLADLLAEVKQVRDQLAAAETQRVAKLASKVDRSEITPLIDEIQRKSEKLRLLEIGIDALSKKINRPGSGSGVLDNGAGSLRDSARTLCETKFLLRVPKTDPGGEFRFHPSEASSTKRRTPFLVSRGC